VRRLGARVGNAHESPAAGKPARHRKPCVTESEHENPCILPMHTSPSNAYRNFSDESPMSTSIIEMIQNLTTT
jgi:hypothetical protein